MGIFKKDRLVFKPTDDNTVLVKDGKKYRLLREKVIGDNVIECVFEEFDEQEINPKIERISKYLVERSGLTITDIVKDLLKEIDTKTLNKIEMQVDRREPVVAEHGCLNLVIGKRKLAVRG